MARGAIYRDLLGFSTELGGGLRASALRRPDGLYSVRGVAARLGLRSPRRGAGSRGTQVAIAVAAPVGGVSDAIDALRLEMERQLGAQRWLAGLRVVSRFVKAR